MKWIPYILTVLVIAYGGFCLVRHFIKRKKRGECGSCCGDCGTCPHVRKQERLPDGEDSGKI